MPTVLLIDGYRFFFYLNEHLPIHIHVMKGVAKARIILDPEIEIDKNFSFKIQEMKQIIVIY